MRLPQRRLVSQEDASIIARPDVPRSKFINAKTRKTTFDAGYLIPFLVDEILPGDHMRYDVTAYIRMNTPLFPMFDNQRIDTHFFYVPNRILWEKWPHLMGEQENPGDSIAYEVPRMNPGGGLGYAIGTIYDHMGLPTQEQALGYWHSALPLRAYNRIWNDWFRDQNMQNKVQQNYTHGAADLPSHYTLLRRAKAHDYFTTALPWPQKFSPPSLPMGGLAPVVGIGTQTPPANPGANAAGVRESDGTTDTYAFYHNLAAAGASAVIAMTTGVAGTAYPAVFADLSQATGVAINTLRQAFLIQGLLERAARGGSRYVERIRAVWNVVSPDFRLQRPEYIGGGQSPLQLTPIAQTAPTTGLTVGALGATGTAVGQHRASYAATEHGYIIGLISVRSELSYSQGIERHWTRRTLYDFADPALMGLGEQAVLRQEIYMTGAQVADETVFGYQERYQEYRVMKSDITGMFKSNITGTLDAWHLGIRYSSPPVLGPTFIEENPPMSRVLAAGIQANGQQYLADILVQREATRPISVNGTPALLGRF